MDINPTQAEVLARIKELPAAVQEAYFSEESAIAIGKITKENSLSAEEEWRLADMVGLVLLGYVLLRDFTQEIVIKLGIDMDKAMRVSDNIGKDIFNPIKKFLTDKKEGARDDTEEIKHALRENSKTVSIKNLVANLK